MTNRKKRAEKGLHSLEIQKEKHLVKREEAYQQKKPELIEYFDKELTNLDNQIAQKKEILHNKKKNHQL